jgi:hypothetical protein
MGSVWVAGLSPAVTAIEFSKDGRSLFFFFFWVILLVMENFRLMTELIAPSGTEHWIIFLKAFFSFQSNTSFSKVRSQYYTTIVRIKFLNDFVMLKRKKSHTQQSTPNWPLRVISLLGHECT